MDPYKKPTAYTIGTYVNPKFNIPPGWSKIDPKTFEKIDGEYRLTVVQQGTHDDWGFTVSRAAVEKIGEASSRLAAMRKAELFVHMRNKVINDA
jgi:hypothetical protein